MHRTSRPRAAALALVAFLASTTAGFAQPPAGDEAPEAPSTIYVPYKNLKGVFDKLGASVVMPYDEWLKLWQRDGGMEKPDPQKVDAVITAAAYTATIEKDLARIQARLTVNVLGKPWVEIPIRFGEAAVGKVEGAGDKVLLRGTGDGTYSLLLGATGEQQVTLELIARVHTSPDGREFALDCPTVGITTFEVLVPEADQTIDITPRQVSLPVEEQAAGTTRVRASLGSTGRITAHWHPRVSLKPEMELLTSVTNLTQVSVEDGLIHTDAYLTFAVLRGKLNQVRIAVPKDHRILDVTSDAKVKGWRTEDGDQYQTVIVELLSGVEQQLTVEVHTERKLPDGAFDVAGQADDGTFHGIHALDAVRESGQVALRHSADLTLTLTEQQGIVRVDAAQTAERIRVEGALAFKFYSPRFALQASVKPVEPRILVNHSANVIFHEDEVRLESGLTYTVDRAGIFQIVLGVPEQIVIDDVQCTAMKEFAFDAQARTLTISLSEKTQGQIGVSVKGHRPFQAGVDMSELPLPILEPRNVERETGKVYLYARESIEVVTNDTGVVAAQPEPAWSGQQFGDAVLTAAWSFTRRPVTIPVTTKRKAARLSVDVATTVNVLPQSAEVTTLLNYHVQFAGLDTFQFQVPEAVSGLAQIETVAVDATSPAIKQKTPSEPANGWVTWTVVMQREVVGTVKLSVKYDLKSAAAADAAAAAEGPASDELTVQLLRALPTPAGNGREAVPLSQIRGEAAVFKEQSLSVTADAEGGDVEAIDIRELVFMEKSGTLAYHYFKQPDEGGVQLKLTRTRHEVEKVIATVVRRALVEIVNGKDGSANYRARFQVKSTERQRLLIELPIGMEPLGGVIVDGREVKLEKAGEPLKNDEFQGYYLNVARTKPSDEEFTIAMQFRWKVSPYPGESEAFWGELSLPLPIIGGRGEDRDTAVQELRVALWIPEDFALVGEPPRFVLDRQPRLSASMFGDGRQVNEQELDQWIGFNSGAGVSKKGMTGYAYSNLGGHERIRVTWWNMIKMTFAISIAIFAIALILSRTSWENKLWILLVAAFFAALVGLRDTDRLAHALSAARYGLAFLVGWWLVRGLFGARTVMNGAAAAAPPAVSPPASAVAVTPTPAVSEPPPAPDTEKKESSEGTP